jgi:cytidylate kinase
MVTDADLRIGSCSIGCRVKRIVSRDQIADEKFAERITLDREKCEAVRYRSYYNIDINDLSIYQIILNSEQWGVEGLGAIVDTAIMQLNHQETG